MVFVRYCTACTCLIELAWIAAAFLAWHIPVHDTTCKSHAQSFPLNIFNILDSADQAYSLARKGEKSFTVALEGNHASGRFSSCCSNALHPSSVEFWLITISVPQHRQHIA